MLAAALLVAACGDEAADEAGPTTTGTSASAPGGAPAPTDGSVTSAEPGSPDAGEAAPSQPVPGPTVVDGTDATPAPPELVVGEVGSLAPAYLRAGPTLVVVEVRSQPGAEPAPAAIDRVAAVLDEVSASPVATSAGPAVAGGARAWTADEIRALADGGAPQSAERPVLRLLFLRGGFAENDRAVGVAVRGDVAAVFADRVDEAAGVFLDRRVVEDAVTMHEVGHLLGLVDLVVDTDRADPEHPGHSPNRGSVMYFAVESTLLGTVLSGGPPRDFDADDLAELAAIRDG